MALEFPHFLCEQTEARRGSCEVQPSLTGTRDHSSAVIHTGLCCGPKSRLFLTCPPGRWRDAASVHISGHAARGHTAGVTSRGFTDDTVSPGLMWAPPLAQIGHPCRQQCRGLREGLHHVGEFCPCVPAPRRWEAGEQSVSQTPRTRGTPHCLQGWAPRRRRAVSRQRSAPRAASTGKDRRLHGKGFVSRTHIVCPWEFKTRMPPHRLGGGCPNYTGRCPLAKRWFAFLS